MNKGRVKGLMIYLTPGDPRTARGAGMEYARTLAGAATSDFLEALAEQEGIIVRGVIAAGFSTRQARTAAREFKAAAQAQWQRIAGAGGGPVGRA